jgi:MFS family permease
MLFLAEDIWFLCLTQLVGGVAFLFIILSSQTYVSRMGDIRLRERGFGAMSFTAAVGQTLGPFCGGYLTSLFAIQTVFLLAFFLSFLGLCVLGLQEETAKPSHTKGLWQNQPLHQIRGLMTDTEVVALLGFCFIVLFAVSLRSSFLPLMLKEKGFSEETLGFLFSVFAFSMTGIRMFMGRAFAYVSRKTFLMISLAAILISVGCIPSLNNIFGLVIIFLSFGLGFGISQPLSMVMIADRSSSQGSGLAMGMRFTTISLATFLSPLVLGWVVSNFGLDWAFYAAFGLVFLGGIFILWLRSQ